MKKVPSEFLLFYVLFTIFNLTYTFAAEPIDVENVQNDVFRAQTPEDYKAIFIKTKNPMLKISVLQTLPMAIKRFNVNTNGVSIPFWLRSIINDALNSPDPKIAHCAIDQIGNNKIVCFTDTLISKYENINIDRNDDSCVLLRTSIIHAAGNLGTPRAIEFIGKIIDLHLIKPETDEAIIAAGKSCAAEIIPKINSYIKYLKARIENNEFLTGDPEKKPLVSPENTLHLAVGTIMSIGNNSCGK